MKYPYFHKCVDSLNGNTYLNVYAYMIAALFKLLF